MIGPTGVGKTEIARRLAKLAQAPSSRSRPPSSPRWATWAATSSPWSAIWWRPPSRWCARRRPRRSSARAAESWPRTGCVELLCTAARARSDLRAAVRLRAARAAAAPRLATPSARSCAPSCAPARWTTSTWRSRSPDSGPTFLRELLRPGHGGDRRQPAGPLQEHAGHRQPHREAQAARARGAASCSQQEEAAKLVDTDRVDARRAGRAPRPAASSSSTRSTRSPAARAARAAARTCRREGVQRDILPIVEGTTVNTKYGPVKTDHVLFIAAGAFHVSKPSRPHPRAAGPLPHPRRAGAAHRRGPGAHPQRAEELAHQPVHRAAGHRGRGADFTDDAVAEIARIAQQVNERTQNIGARRLHTVLERLLDEVSLRRASELGPQATSRSTPPMCASAWRDHRQGRGPVPLHPLA